MGKGDEMKIIVLNGSPKGDLSVTMQYIHYVHKRFPQHEWVVHNISQRINAIEKKEEAFREIMDNIRSAAGVVWAFPVYFLLVPSNYKRFIELIWERGAEDAFKDKYTASLSTSIHYYDHIAHQYIHAICDDLGMKYVDGFSADMYDLLDENERKRLLLFAKHYFGAIASHLPRPKNFRPLVQNSFEYAPVSIAKKIDTENRKLVVLTDAKNEETNLTRMIQQFAAIVSKDGYVKPITFLGLAGRKIIRDDIFGRLRFPFRADHNFFKRHGAYDYPQKNHKLRIRNSIMLWLSRMPSFRKEVYTRRMKSEMVKPLQKIVERE